MENKFTDELYKQFTTLIKGKFGERVIDGRCAFCGEEIVDKNGYCKCTKSQQINKYSKKASQHCGDVLNSFAFGDSLEDIFLNLKKTLKTPPLFIGMDFNSYQVTNESQKNALKTVIEYKENIFENYLFGRNLVLLGNYGTGKTMLMSILANSIVEKSLLQVKFINAVDLINSIKDTFNHTQSPFNSTSTALGIADLYKKAQVLFLDDIDKINPTQYIQEVFYAIVNYRVEHELPTIISANHTLEELDEKYFGEAIVSRMVANSKIISFTHKNMRVDKCKK